MTTHDMRPWNYFLTLEREFSTTTSFIEPHEKNYKTFSDRYAGLLLLIGSEIDVMAKELSKKISNGNRPYNMESCSKEITKRYPELHTVEIDVNRYNIKFKPWKSWGHNPPEKPSWWDDYNSVKHDRLSSRERASQATILNGLCGLLVINLYFYGTDIFLFRHPEILDYGFPPILVDHSEKTIPGI